MSRVKIVAFQDFVKVVGYELEFLKEQLDDAHKLAKQQVERTAKALEFHDQLIQTLGHGLNGDEWRLGVTHSIEKHLPTKGKSGAITTR